MRACTAKGRRHLSAAPVHEERLQNALHVMEAPVAQRCLLHHALLGEGAAQEGGALGRITHCTRATSVPRIWGFAFRLRLEDIRHVHKSGGIEPLDCYGGTGSSALGPTYQASITTPHGVRFTPLLRNSEL